MSLSPFHDPITQEPRFLGRYLKPSFAYTSAHVLTVAASTAAPAYFVIAGKLHEATSDLTLDITTSGLGGLRTGLAVAATTLYYLYAVADSTTVSLIADTVAPTTGLTGYARWTYLGKFWTNAASDIRPSLLTDAVAARYTSNAAQAIGTVLEDVDFEDKDIDTHDAVTVAAGVDPWIFTAPIAGYYNVCVVVGFASEAYAAGNRVYITIYRNGASYGLTSYKGFDAAITSTLYLTGSHTVYLAAGHTVTIMCASNRAAGDSTTTATPAYKNIEITLWAPAQSENVSEYP